MSLTGIGLAAGKGLVTGAAIGAVGNLTPIVGGIIGAASSATSNLVDQAASGQKINPAKVLQYAGIGFGVGLATAGAGSYLKSDVGSELFYNNGIAFPGSTLAEPLNAIEKEAIGNSVDAAGDITNDIYDRMYGSR